MRHRRAPAHRRELTGPQRRYKGTAVFDISPIQIIIVLVIALVVFGPKRLPELGRSVGRGLREFKGAINGESAPRTPVQRADEASTAATAPAATATPAAAPADLAPAVETDTLEGVVVSGDAPPPARPADPS